MRTAELYVYLRNLKLPAPWSVTSAFEYEENGWWTCLVRSGTSVRIYHYNGVEFIAVNGLLIDATLATFRFTHQIFDTPEAALAYAEMKWGSQ